MVTVTLCAPPRRDSQSLIVAITVTKTPPPLLRVTSHSASDTTAPDFAPSGGADPATGDTSSTSRARNSLRSCRPSRSRSSGSVPGSGSRTTVSSTDGIVRCYRTADKGLAPPRSVGRVRRPRRPRLPRQRGLLRGGVDAGLLALRLGDRRRRTGERVVAGTGLREGDHLADRLDARQQRGEPVPPEGRAGVRRRAVGEGLQEEAEPLPGLLAGHPQRLEHPLLQRGVVDTDRAAHDLVAVDHHVVGVRERRTLVLGEVLPPLGRGRGERVVHERPGAVLGLLEHREVDDEEERPRAGLDELQPLGDLVAGRAEQLLRGPAAPPRGKKTDPPPPPPRPP